MILDEKDLCFCVKMVNGTHLHTADECVEGGALDVSEFLDWGGRGVGEPDGGDVGEQGESEGFVGEGEGLLALHPWGASKGTEKLEMWEK